MRIERDNIWVSWSVYDWSKGELLLVMALESFSHSFFPLKQQNNNNNNTSIYLMSYLLIVQNLKEQRKGKNLFSSSCLQETDINSLSWNFWRHFMNIQASPRICSIFSFVRKYSSGKPFTEFCTLFLPTRVSWR